MADLKNTTINDTGFLKLPAGDETQKPEVAETGMVRFNTDAELFEVYDGEEWREILLTPPAIPPGQEIFDEPGSFTWIAPEKVTSVSVVAIGGGGGTQKNGSDWGGAGGGLGWKNNIPVTPGEEYDVVVGAGGVAIQNGGNSYFISLETVAGYGGGNGRNRQSTGGPNANGYGGGYFGDGGGAGGVSTSNWRGGGGAGGYTGRGGNNQESGTQASGTSGAASGGGYNGTAWGGGGGGGVGLDGQGPSGSGWVTEGGPTTNNSWGGGGDGGSGGERGEWGGTNTGSQGENGPGGNIGGGDFGGGAGGSGNNSNPNPLANTGGKGGVKIIWGNRASNEPGAAVITRAYPDSNTQDIGGETP